MWVSWDLMWQFSLVAWTCRAALSRFLLSLCIANNLNFNLLQTSMAATCVYFVVTAVDSRMACNCHFSPL